MAKQYSRYNDSELFTALRDSATAELAFTELYQRHSARIYEYCLRIVGSQVIAEDMFQETFVRFYKSVEQHDKIENVIGYLMTIARNLCLNHKRLRREFAEVEEHFLQDVSGTRTIEAAELMQLITAALELLDTDYREVFVLREFDGFTYGEIAEIVGSTEATVKTRVFRAKQKIQSILQPYLQDIQRHG